MSTANITSIIPIPGGDEVMCSVTFECRHGQGETRTYVYVGRAAEDILAGADPAAYAGERIS